MFDRVKLGEKETGLASYRDAVIEALDEEMERDPDVFILGEDVGRMGGNFATTRGLWAKYGETRVRDTPISEDAILGTALGASIQGLRPVAEIMFSSFLGCAMDEIWNHIGTIHYVTRGLCVPRLTIRTVNVIGRSSGAHHSGRPESALMHVPGIVVVAPATAFDAKAMLKFSVRADDPVVFIEHALLYASAQGDLGGSEDLVPFGKASVRRFGDDVTLVGYSGSVRTVDSAARALERKGIQATVIDLRSLNPWDREAVCKAAARTHNLVVVEEDSLTAGVGAEVAASVAEELGPQTVTCIRRLAAGDSPVPFAPVLEEAIMPSVAKVIDTASALVGASGPLGRT